MMTKTKPDSITIHYNDRDGGWYKVMRNGNCVEDFRDQRCADSYARALRKEARAEAAKG